MKEAKRTMMDDDGADQVRGNEVLVLDLAVMRMLCTLKTQRYHIALYHNGKSTSQQRCSLLTMLLSSQYYRLGPSRPRVLRPANAWKSITAFTTCNSLPGFKARPNMRRLERNPYFLTTEYRVT